MTTELLEQVVLEGWNLPLRMDAFLDWLDDTQLGEGTDDALAAFLKLPAASEMPVTLTDDLRAAGWLEAAQYAESLQ